MARSNKVGELRVELVASLAGFKKDMTTAGTVVDKTELKVTTASNRMGKSFATMGSKVALTTASIVKSIGLVTAATGAFLAVGAGYAVTRSIQSLLKVSETVDEIGKASKRLGMTTEEMSALRYSAALAGTDFAQFATMTSKALKTVAKEVAAGHATMKLGRTEIQLTNINGRIRDTSSLLQDVARAIERAGDPAKKLELAQKIFGKGGADAFVTMLNESGGALQNLAEQRDKLRARGGLYSEDQVRRLTEMNDAILDVGYAWEAVQVQVIDHFAPRITEFMDWLSSRVSELPSLARAASNAIAQFASGDLVEREKAAAAIDSIRDALLDVAGTAAIESGKLLATAFVEAMSIGLATIAPDIRDIARDILGPIVNPILGITLQEQIAPSIGSQLKSARTKLREYQDAIADVGRVRVNEQWDLEGNRGPLNKWIAERRVEAADLVAKRHMDEMKSPDGLLMQIKSLEQAKAMQDMERRAALAHSMADGFDATANAATRLRNVLSQKFDAVGARKDDLLALMGEDGTSVAAEVPSARLAMFADGLDQFWSRVQSVGAKAQAVGAKVAAGFRDLMAFRTDLWNRQQLATSTEEEGKRIQMLSRFADEEADAVKRFGRNGQILTSLRAVQILELKKFNDDLRAEADKKAAQERQRRQEEVRSLIESVAPRERFLNERDKIEKAFRDGLIDNKFRKNFEDLLFRMELETDMTFGGRMAQSIWEFRSTFNDSLADMIETSKFSFGSIADQFQKMLLRMALMQLAVEPMFQGLIGFGRGLFTSSAPVPVVHGEAINPGDAWADGGVVRKPVTFEAGGRRHVMGEAGPEAIVPLDEFMGGRGSGTTVNVYNQAGADTQVQVESGRGAGGQDVVEITILKVINSAIDAGRFDRRLKGRFNIGPVASRR